MAANVKNLHRNDAATVAATLRSSAVTLREAVRSASPEERNEGAASLAMGLVRANEIEWLATVFDQVANGKNMDLEGISSGRHYSAAVAEEAATDIAGSPDEEPRSTYGP